MNPPNWNARNPTQDPLGPGSPAWEAFDVAVLHAKDRNLRLFSAANARMCRLLKANGLTPAQIAAWRSDLERTIDE